MKYLSQNWNGEVQLLSYIDIDPVKLMSETN